MLLEDFNTTPCLRGGGGWGSTHRSHQLAPMSTKSSTLQATNKYNLQVNRVTWSCMCLIHERYNFLWNIIKITRWRNIWNRTRNMWSPSQQNFLLYHHLALSRNGVSLWMNWDHCRRLTDPFHSAGFDSLYRPSLSPEMGLHTSK